MPNQQQRTDAEVQAFVRSEKFCEDLKVNHGHAVAYMARLKVACPGVSANVLLEAVLRHWDMCPAEDKLGHIHNAAVKDFAFLEDNTIFPCGSNGPGNGDAPPSHGSLEFWPALADAWSVPHDEAGDGRYVIRTDEVGGGKGKWIATVTPNPAFDQFSRMRIARLMALSAEMWQLLREATDVGADELGVEDRRGGAVRLLSEAGDFVPRPAGKRDATDPADDARRGVNDETIYRLPDGEPALEVANV